MVKTEHYGYVKDGVLVAVNKNRLAQDLKQFPDCDVVLTIKKRGKRSLLQNNYYHGVVVKEIQIRLRELGHDVDCDTVHEFLKCKFNSEKVVTPQAEVIEVPKSTTEMNKGEFVEYVERIRAWAADMLEIWIPDPGQQSALFFDRDC